jgi:KDO2-lipid IV(A) lauroyltransferase
VGWIAGGVLGVRRKHVERSMKLAGIVRSRAPVLAAMMYRSLGRSLVEMLWLAARPKVAASELTVLDEYSRAVLAAAREQGRGVVLATAHAGNWELAAAAIAEAYPLTVVAKPMSVGWIDRFCRTARVARGITVAMPDGAIRAARAALRRGELVAMLIDQVPARASHSVEVEFLCGNADADRSPATLAAAMGAPLAVAVSHRLPSGKQSLEILAVLEPPATGRLAWAVEATHATTRVFERWVHAHPYEWLWMHRRWRLAAGRPSRRPPGSAAPQTAV